MPEITKGEIVDMALSFLAASGSLISPPPDVEAKFLRFLEIMVPSWTARSLSIGYRLSPNGIDPDASEDSGIAIDDAAAVASNLAVYAAGSIGIIPSQDLKHQANEAWCALFVSHPISRVSNPYMPEGTGSNYSGRPYYQPSEENITVEDNGNLDDFSV